MQAECCNRAAADFFLVGTDEDLIIAANLLDVYGSPICEIQASGSNLLHVAQNIRSERKKRLINNQSNQLICAVCNSITEVKKFSVSYVTKNKTPILLCYGHASLRIGLLKILWDEKYNKDIDSKTEIKNNVTAVEPEIIKSPIIKNDSIINIKRQKHIEYYKKELMKSYKSRY